MWATKYYLNQYIEYPYLNKLNKKPNVLGGRRKARRKLSFNLARRSLSCSLKQLCFRSNF